jgi:hypothetical protein
MKDILIRAGKTFIQGFLATLTVTVQGADLTNTFILRGLLVGAAAAGISAVMNLLLKATKKK